MRAPQQSLLTEMHAAQALLARTRGPSDAAIHLARQHVKRARAILRLVSTAGPALYRQVNRVLRDANRALREARDRAVVSETLRSLGVRKPYLQPAISDIESYWRLHRGDGHGLAVPAQDRHAALDALALAAAAVRNSRRLARSFEQDIPAAIQMSYRKARQAYRRAARKSSDAAWHECRKQTKYLHYQLQIADEQQWQHPGALDQSDRLQSMLGKQRDLALLTAELQRTGADRGAAGKAVLLCIKRRRARLARKCDDCGRELFLHKAAAFAQRLRNKAMAERSGYRSPLKHPGSATLPSQPADDRPKYSPRPQASLRRRRL